METWTEYAVRWDDNGKVSESTRSADTARRWLANTRWPGIVVGATVTRSDWLPVDQDGAS